MERAYYLVVVVVVAVVLVQQDWSRLTPFCHFKL
jgi:hypothetical protein